MTEIITLEYDKHLSDNPEIKFHIRSSMEQGLRILVKGPTGSGKTVLIGQIAKDILEDEKRLKCEQSKIVLTCPNVIQNKQNQENKLIGAKSFTKGESLEGKRFISAVYDKAYVAINADEKVHLILDEAHKRIYDETYRPVALDQVKQCEDNAFSSTHVTATPRVLMDGIYKYDKVIICEPKNSKLNNNIEELEVVAMPIANRQAIFTNFLIEKVKNRKNSEVILCRLNSKAEIEKMSENIVKIDSNIRISSIISKDKEDNPLFNSIVEKGLIGNDFDIVFVTSLLDAGTSIYQENIELIYHCRTSHDMSFDENEQFLARARKKIKKATITTSADDYELISLKDIKDKNKKERNRTLASFNKLIEALQELKTPKEDIIKTVEQRLNFELEETKTSLGCIQLDEDKMKCFINNELAQSYDYREYDRQYYKAPIELIKLLPGMVKTDKINLTYYSNQNDEIKELIEQDKAKKDEDAKLKKDEGRKILAKEGISSNLLFQDLINRKELFLDFVDEEVKEDLEFLKEEETLLDEIKDLMEVGMDIEQATHIVSKAKKPKDVKIAKQTYQAILLNTRKRYSMIDDNFTRMHKIIREELKPLERSRGRITDEKINCIYLKLVKEGILEQRKKPKNKILELINLIYNTSKIKNEKNNFKISSVKTNTKTLK